MAFRRAAAISSATPFQSLKEARLANEKEQRELLESVNKSYHAHSSERNEDVDAEDVVMQKEDAYQRSRIAKLCTSIGLVQHGPGGAKFTRGENCLRQLKKLRRAINRDRNDERQDTVLQLGELNFVQDVLIPLVRQSADELPLLLELTKLAVLLTMLPPEESLQADTEEERKSKQVVARMRLQQLREYKSLFLGKGVMSSFNALLHEPLMVPSERRTEEDKTYIELVLNLIRNLLAVPDQAISHTTHSSNAHMNNLQENFVLMLERESVIDVLLHLAECVGLSGNSDWNLILLDSFFHLFRGTTAEDLCFTSSTVTKSSTNSGGEGTGRRVTQRMDSQTEQLQSLLSKSKAKRSQSLGMASRHSRFGGVFRGPGNKVFQLAHKMHQSTTNKTAFSTTKVPIVSSRRKKDESALSAVVAKQSRHVIRSPRYLKALREVCEGLIAKCFSPLMRGLKVDVNRGDARVTPTETVQFLWLASYCLQYQRLNLQEADFKEENRTSSTSSDEFALPSQRFDWTNCPLFVMMDKWSFQYVIKRCHAHFETGKWAALEVDVKVYREMMSVMLEMRKSAVEQCRKRGRIMQNSVFYELGEVEIIAQLLRTWDPTVHSHEFLVDLCILVDHLLDIAKGMEEDGVVVQTARKRTKKKSVFEKEQGEDWGSEETHALVEGVREFGSSSKSFRKMLKDEQLGQLFLDKSRTYKQLAARWKYINIQVDAGKSIEKVIEEEASGQTNEEKADDADTATAEIEETLDQINTEHEVKFESFFRRFVANTSVSNMVRAIDPDTSWFACCTTGQKFMLFMSVGKFLERVRDLDRKESGNIEGMLWHVQTLSTYYRVLDSYKTQLATVKARGNDGEFSRMQEATVKMVDVIRSTVNRFFAHATKNPAAFIEILFWRTKAENVAMSRSYNDVMPSRRRKHRDTDHVGSDIDEEEMDFTRMGPDSGGEEEATFDASGTTDTAHNEANGKRVNSRRPKNNGRNKWTIEEDRLLQRKFPRLSYEFPDTVYELLSLEDELRGSKRTANQIKLRVKDLMLRTLQPGETTGSSQVTDNRNLPFALDASSPFDSKFRRKVFDIISMTGPAKAVAQGVSAADILTFLVQQLESAAEVQSTAAQSHSRLPGFSVVPTSESIGLWLQEPRLSSLMRLLGFRAPNRTHQANPKKRRKTNICNERYWRVLENLDEKILLKLSDRLKDAVLDATTLQDAGQGWLESDSESEGEADETKTTTDLDEAENSGSELSPLAQDDEFRAQLFCWPYEPFLPEPNVQLSRDPRKSVGSWSDAENIANETEEQQDEKSKSSQNKASQSHIENDSSKRKRVRKSLVTDSEDEAEIEANLPKIGKRYRKLALSDDSDGSDNEEAQSLQTKSQSASKESNANGEFESIRIAGNDGTGDNDKAELLETKSQSASKESNANDESESIRVTGNDGTGDNDKAELLETKSQSALKESNANDDTEAFRTDTTNIEAGPGS